MNHSTPIWFYSLAYILSLARLPFALIPYLCKIGLFRLPGGWFQRHWDDYPVQLARIIGDCLNVALTTLCFYHTRSWSKTPFLGSLFLLALLAETIRLLAEKGVMLVSAAWQALPHRQAARWLERQGLVRQGLVRLFGAYCAYYALSDQDRLARVLLDLRRFAAADPRAAQKLDYVRAFRILPVQTGLRCGQVRDVARGEIYIHPGWTNQPDLLRGLALRRSPWIYDPRHLRRPFYYRTQANRLMTLTVFEFAGLCPLYSVYQFGHEIKTARYDAYFRLLRWLGINAESPVLADGTYGFDSLAVSLQVVSGKPAPRALWTDDEVLLALAGQACLPTAQEIASTYTYPLVYVQEVLLPRLQAAFEKASRAA